jgi:hypothetical protein
LLVSLFLGFSACGDDDGDEPEASGPQETTATSDEPPTLDAAKVESTLKRNLDGVELFALPATIYPDEGGPPEQSQVGGGRLRVRSVTCPPDVPLERGGTFTCDLDARRGASGTVRMTQLDGSGKKLRFKATIESEAGTGIPVETELKGRIRVG